MIRPIGNGIQKPVIIEPAAWEPFAIGIRKIKDVVFGKDIRQRFVNQPESIRCS
jgi:hypothetical protein